MLAQKQQQEANLLYHQYNQISLMRAAYSNPTLTAIPFAPTPIDPQQAQQQAQQAQQQQQQQQQQQVYRPDQVVPLVTPTIPTPTQSQIASTSPINMVKISSPDTWLTNHAIAGSQDMFQPISHAISRSVLDIDSYNTHRNSIQSNSSSPMVVTYESPTNSRHRHSQQYSIAENYQRRDRAHSASSCYESDSPDILTDDDEEFSVRFLFLHIHHHFLVVL